MLSTRRSWRNGVPVSWLITAVLVLPPSLGMVPPAWSGDAGAEMDPSGVRFTGDGGAEMDPSGWHGAGEGGAEMDPSGFRLAGEGGAEMDPSG